tara:strand:- start:46 stop:816 length:771 start_codon:yes stop_codon:yes gene_type:complete
MVIYKITNNINDKIYIGKDVRNRNQYYGSGVHIKRAIEKYGKENFTKDIIDTADDYEELSAKEIYWISEYKKTHILYNISAGGDGGDTWSNNDRVDRLRKSVIIEGKEYNSITDASDDFSLERSVIRYRCNSPHFAEWYFKSEGKNTEPVIDPHESKRKKVIIDGVVYNSVTHACEVLNKRYDYINRRLRSKSYPNYKSLDGRVEEDIVSGKKNRLVSVFGITYQSVTEAAKKTNINRRTLNYRLMSNNFKDYIYI